MRSEKKLPEGSDGEGTKNSAGCVEDISRLDDSAPPGTSGRKGGSEGRQTEDSQQTQDTAVAHNEEPKDGDKSVEIEAVEKKRAKKKKKRKKGKRFVPLPILANIEEHLPWKMSFNQKQGRHATAAHSISAGELVLVERAVAAVPREHCAPHLCHWCFRTLPEVKMVVNGDNRMYCSRQCIQESARWGSAASDVQRAVSAIAQDTGCDSALLRMVVELESLREWRPSGGLQVRSKDGTDAKGTVEKHCEGEWWKDAENEPSVCAGWEDVQTLLSHWEKRPDDWRKSVTAASKALLPILAKAYSHRELAAVTLQELQELAAVVNSNAHGVGQMTGGDNTDVAFGLFPVLSLFNHSCRPNCCFHADGPVMCVRAVSEIKEGQQLTVSYINLFEPRWVRSKQLLETRFFTCSCVRCSEPIVASTDRLLEGVRCSKRKCPGLLLALRSSESPEEIMEWRCNDCGLMAGKKDTDKVVQEEVEESKAPKVGMEVVEPQECVDSAQQSLEAALALYKQRRSREALAKLENHIKKFDAPGQLSQFHVHLFDSWTPLMNCSRRNNDLHTSVKYCQKVIHAMETILDIPSIELGNYYQCLGEMLSLRSGPGSLPTAIRDIHKKQAQEAFRKALNIRRVCLGLLHHSTQEILAQLRKL